MSTKSVSLVYNVTTSEVIPPSIRDIEIKERWIRDVQATVEADWKPKAIKVTYEVYDPEVENLRRFFNGTMVKYYAIQDQDMFEGEPSSALLKMYREDLLDELLGYDVRLVNRTVRRRKSTSDYKTIQKWLKFINMAQETVFDSAGYEFPDSKEFWELVKQHGYEQAERISIKRLQKTIKSKLNK